MKNMITSRLLPTAFIVFLSLLTTSAQVTADFSASTTSGCAPLRVEFINQSANSIEWDWNFGDGSTSFDEHPVHYYTTPGVYTVSLTAYGGGASDTETKVAYITVRGFEVEVEGIGSTCGLANGSLDVTIIGGTAPFSYAWNNGANTEDLTGLTAGSYRITITDATGCQFSESYLIENANHLTLTVVKTHVSTPGGSDGAINLTVSGGTGPYSYSWNNGTYTTEDLANLPAGTYCVLVTDVNGCAEDGCFNVEQPGCGDFTVTAVVQDASCGMENGSINLTVQFGTPPFSFNWSNGAAIEDLTWLSPGNYRVTVEDANGCRFTETFFVESTNNLSISGTVQHYKPGVHNGSIVLSVIGGNPSYIYNWSNGETGSIIDGLLPGTYCVTVTDEDGCYRDKCFLIETIGGCSTLSVSGVVHGVVSPPGENGYIELFVTGGTPPYTYIWSNGADGRILDGLSIGTYCVTVTDATGCVEDKCFVVEFAPPGCTLTITGAVTDASTPNFNNGQITLTITGGTSPYTYSWSNGATTKNIENLTAGQYCVIVTDVTGCTRDKCFVVENLMGGCSDFEVEAQITNANCGAANGSINLIVSGGTAPYSFTWNNGSTDEDRYGLSPGLYRVTVEDNGTCIFSETFEVSTSGNDLAITGTVTNVSAPGVVDGAINVTVTGGDDPYTYNWTHGATTQDLSGLEVGTYCLLVTDANGCLADKCFNVEGPGCGDFNVTGVVTHVGCGGTPGAINVTVQFGTPPYFYAWSNGATTEDISGLASGYYTVTVEDSGPCRKVKTFHVEYSGGFQIMGTVTPAIGGTATGAIVISMSGGAAPYTFQWSNGATTQNIDNLAPGQYCVLVTSANGCVEDKCFTVGVSGGCGDFYVTAHDDRYLCGPGELFLEANAYFGTQPYTFSWSPVTGLDNPDSRVTVALVSTTTAYTVTATDDHGCTASDEITVYVVNPGGNNAGVAFDSVTICRGDSVQLAAFGGTSYYWNPGNGLSDRNSPTPWASPEVSKNYFVIIGNGACEQIFSVHVKVDEDCVWPGDANSDGIANNQDVLAIGIGFGISGFTRPNATSNWEGQLCPDWLLALASGPNLKHVDCDGSGTIDAADTIPLYLNYGLTHNRSGSPGQKFVDPELYFDLPDDTALAGQAIAVPVYLGTHDIQASNFYGIAFSVNYDNTIVEEGTMHFAPVNSFAGNVGDLLSFDFDLYGESKMDVALTRLNRVSVSGYGQIGTISFTMKDDISGKDFLVRELILSFSDVRGIDNNENELLLFYEPGSMFVKQEVNGITQSGNEQPQLSIYPNP
ncbi:MAG TPA: PKD domain-containing protein, partial [Chitinophagales bacterium]|nr:PKD domain-containing protein [Chitinophagales bacterium]